MHKMFQYRLNPTKKQVQKLNETLDECRWLYNHLLETRKTSYAQHGEHLSCYGQINTFPLLKTDRPTLTRVHSQVLQNVAVRIDLAFQAFFRRCKAGETPGFPRFRGADRYDSFCFPQSGFSLTHDHRVTLSKIGKVKMVYHRPLKGTMKTCTIHRSSTGKWYVSFSVECEPERLKPIDTQVGIDVGLKTFATLSTGEEIAPPKFFRQEERLWQRCNASMPPSKRGRLNDGSIATSLPVFTSVSLFAVTTSPIKRPGRLSTGSRVICIEDLHVNRMVHNHCRASSISDAAWSHFFDRLSSKAEEAGRAFVKVNPAYTSQECNKNPVWGTGIHHRQKMQRPFAQERITSDLALLSELLEIFRRLVPGKARRLNLVSGFNEFKRYTLQELDFSLEAKTLARFKHNFSAWPDIIIPQVYWDFVTPKVLTMQRVSGLRLHEITPTLSEAQRKRLSHRLLEMEMKMFIADGFFHADLHPGNIFFTEDGKIVLLDFGMYGELSDEHRDHFILYWYAGLQRQLKRAFYHLIKQTTLLKHADEDAYYETFKELAEHFYNSTLAERSLTQTYLAIIRNGTKFGFVFPSDLLLQAKALTTAEALAFTLTPDLKFETEMPPIIAYEFAQRATDFGRLKVLAERVLPELLLFGELPPASIREPSVRDVSFQPNWGDALTMLGEQVKAMQPNIANMRSLLDPSAHKAFIHVYSDHEVDDLLASTWARYADLAPSVPFQETVGARIMVHLSALTMAMYEALLSAGQSAEGATTLIHDTAWLVYTKMGEVPWTMAGAMSNDGVKKLRFATKAFRTFPFDSPSYLWKDVSAAPDVVAFDCLKCPVAEHFRAHNLSDLCVNTWCKLDYPLARQWGPNSSAQGQLPVEHQCVISGGMQSKEELMRNEQHWGYLIMASNKAESSM